MESYSFELGREMYVMPRAECFKRRCDSMLDAYVAGKILTEHDAVTTQGLV